MMEIKDFRKLKISFLKEDNSFLKEKEVEEILKNTQDMKEKWFLRGVIHILENHFSEAIKRFQLVNCKEAVLLILACSYKTKDDFIFNEYRSKILEIQDCGFFKKYSIKPTFLYGEKTLPLDKILNI
jgi:hypothetical protein